jgi:hypothetical protein
MHAFNIKDEQEWDPRKHVEKILTELDVGAGQSVPGSFCVHPPGEVHEYMNGPQRTLLFRVRHGTDMLSRHVEWPSNPDFKQSAEDAAYYRQHPPR